MIFPSLTIINHGFPMDSPWMNPSSPAPRPGSPRCPPPAAPGETSPAAAAPLGPAAGSARAAPGRHRRSRRRRPTTPGEMGWNGDFGCWLGMIWWWWFFGILVDFFRETTYLGERNRGILGDWYGLRWDGAIHSDGGSIQAVCLSNCLLIDPSIHPPIHTHHKHP